VLAVALHLMLWHFSLYCGIVHVAMELHIDHFFFVLWLWQLCFMSPGCTFHCDAALVTVFFIVLALPTEFFFVPQHLLCAMVFLFVSQHLLYAATLFIMPQHFA